jgi:hypothetical protein
MFVYRWVVIAWKAETPPPSQCTSKNSLKTFFTCSDVDLQVPTLLGLAGGDCAGDAALLPGRNLFPANPCPPRLTAEAAGAVGGQEGGEPDETYFVTLDNVLDGPSRFGTAGRRFPPLGAVWPMAYPPLKTTQTAVEALVAKRSADGHIWKLVRTFDPALHQKACGADGDEARSSSRSSGTEAPSATVEGHWCLFDLTHDPSEQKNLACNTDQAAYAANGERLQEVVADMKRRLALARSKHGGSLTKAESSAFKK